MRSQESIIRQYDAQKMSIEELYEQIRQDFQGIKLERRVKFNLVSEYMSWVYEGKKHTTVRYRVNAIDIPVALDLPLYEVINNNSCSESKEAGYVAITNMVVKSFGLLNQYDADQDGFRTEYELKEALQILYEPIIGRRIKESEYVTVYTIHLV